MPILDRLSWYRVKRLAKEPVEPVYLPASSPEHSRIETLWRVPKAG